VLENKRYTHKVHKVCLLKTNTYRLSLDSPYTYNTLLNYSTMSFSDRRRDSGEGRGVEGKYIP